MSDFKDIPPDDWTKTTPNVNLPNSPASGTPGSTGGEPDWAKTNYRVPVPPSAVPSDDFGKTVTNIKPIDTNRPDFGKTMYPGAASQPPPADWGATQANVNVPSGDFGSAPSDWGPGPDKTTPYFQLPESERLKYQQLPPTPTEQAAKAEQEQKARGGIPAWVWVVAGLMTMFFFAVAVLGVVYFFILRDSSFEVTVKGAPAGSDILIDEKLIVAEATKQGITVPEAELNRQAQEALKEAKGRYASVAEYQEALRSENLTEEKLLKKFHDEAQRAALVQRLVSKQITRRRPTQAEAEAYFKSNPDKFPRAPAEVRLSVIQIPAQPDSDAIRKGRVKAEAVRKRILAGEKFAKVASEVSEDETSARSGGDLGYLPRGGMDPSFEQAVFSRKLNTVGEPVRSMFGWHVLEVLDRDTVKTAARRDSIDREGRPLLEAHVRHVLIRVPLTEADVERARALANKVRAEAASGKDFGELARRYSRYAGPHGEDGDIGYVPMTWLQPNIRAGLDSLPVGGISEVLIDRAGFSIFRVTERKAEREYSLEEIKSELPTAVSEIQFREKLDEWVKGLRAKAHIQINKS